MLERHFHSLRVRSRIQDNPIGKDLERLVVYLDERGHSAHTIQAYLQAAEHFGTWLATTKPRRLIFDEDAVQRFLERHLPQCRCDAPAPRHLQNTRAALKHLLRATGKNAKSSSSDSISKSIKRILADYAAHLETNCGLANETCRYRVRYAQEFLAHQFPRGRVCWGSLRPAQVMRFVANAAASHKRSSAQVAACSLRSFLRFLHTRGLCAEGIVRAVPWIPQWKLSNLPKVMTEEQLHRFLDSFDKSTATGRRDFAMALCMVELGLRVSEVVQINLEDLDWRNSLVQIHSAKERRVRVLPLTKNLGKALATYLKSGRPTSLCRRAFLRHRAPAGNPVSRELVRGVMRRTYERSGCPTDWTGTHILRHTAATRLHQRGATLKEIADLLGHRSINTTTIYTKVNLPMLRAVALPWPEVRS